MRSGASTPRQSARARTRLGIGGREPPAIPTRSLRARTRLGIGGREPPAIPTPSDVAKTRSGIGGRTRLSIPARSDVAKTAPGIGGRARPPNLFAPLARPYGFPRTLRTFAAASRCLVSDELSLASVRR